MAKEHPDLYKKVIKGGFWVFALRVVTQVISMIRLVILARLLAPSDFGLMGIALLLISILETVTQTGFQAALIQKDKDITPYLNTAWTTNIIRGALLYAILFFAAPFAANIKIPPEQIATAIGIIRVTGVAIIIGSFSNIATVYFQKELNFDKTFILTSISNLLGIVVSIVIAIIYKTPWALVAGKIINTTMATLMSYRMHSFRPKLQFEYTKFLELWRFGRWIAASSILGFLINYGDDFFVWFFLGTEALGFYQLAYRIAMMPVDEISNLITKITLPAFSKVARDKLRLKNAYLKIHKLTANCVIPVSTAIIILIPTLSPIIFGEKWDKMIVLIQILSFKAIFFALSATRGPLFTSLGLPGIGMKFKFIRFIVTLLLIYPMGHFFGLTGICITVTIACIVPMLPAYKMANNLIGSKWIDILNTLRVSIFITIAAILMSILIKYALNSVFIEI